MAYSTRLNPDEEREFRSWVQTNNIPFDPGPEADYDMRGFWRAMKAGQVQQDPESGHFPDTFKTPYHETFSNESMYATPDAPHWEGSKLVDKSGNVVKDETVDNLKREYEDTEDLVTVRNPDGEAGTVPRADLDLAMSQGYSVETPAQAHARNNPLDAKITSFGLGLADAMTFGATKPFRNAVGDPNRLRELDAMQAQEPGWGLAGTGAGLLGGLPAMKAVGKIGAAAEARGAGPLARYATEGVALSSPEAAMELALGDPEAAAEKIVYGATTGAVIGGLIGAGRGVVSNIGKAAKSAHERRANLIAQDSRFMVEDKNLLANTVEKYNLNPIAGEKASELAGRVDDVRHNVWMDGTKELDPSKPVSIFTTEEAATAPVGVRGFVEELSIPGELNSTLTYVENARKQLMGRWGTAERELAPFVDAAEDRLLAGTSVGAEHGVLSRMQNAAMSNEIALKNASAWTGVMQLVGGRASTAIGGMVGHSVGGLLGAGIGGMVGHAIGSSVERGVEHGLRRAPDTLLSAIARHGEQLERMSLTGTRAPEMGITIAQRMLNKVDLQEAAANPLSMESEIMQATAGVQDSPELSAFTAGKLQQIAQYLSQYQPESPSPTFGNPVVGAPNPAEVKSYKDREEIAFNPYAIIKHVRDGSLTQEHIETIESLAPNIWSDIKDRIVDEMSRRKAIPFTSRATLARIYNMEGDPAWSQIYSYQSAYVPTDTSSFSMPKPKGSSLTQIERITAK